AARVTVRRLRRTLRARRTRLVRLLALPVAWVEVVARRQVAVRAHLGRAAHQERVRPQHSGRVVQLHHAGAVAVGVADLVLHPRLHPPVDRRLVQRVAAVHQVLAVRVVLGVVLKLAVLHPVRRRDRQLLAPLQPTHVGGFARWHQRRTRVVVRLHDVVAQLRSVRVRAHTAVVHVRLAVHAVRRGRWPIAVRVRVHLDEQQRTGSENDLHIDNLDGQQRRDRKRTRCKSRPYSSNGELRNDQLQGPAQRHNHYRASKPILDGMGTVEATPLGRLLPQSRALFLATSPSARDEEGGHRPSSCMELSHVSLEMTSWARR
ncbi:TPA: hypothetical protein N0F65_000077, partial [Lagenidium giganteum]